MFANLPLHEMTHYGTRTAASCKECRRLKLKCDKKVPCSSCIRRGCASICPTGQMVAKGSRYILANTEELHGKIDTLISRIHSLEGALEASHLTNSSQSHPLLRDELRLIATPMASTLPDSEPITEEETLSDSIGTLTVDGRGSRYFGYTGAFASLWIDGYGRRGPEDPETNSKEALALALAGLPLEIAHMAHAFPIRIPTNENSSHLSAWILENCLPPYEEAWSLFENYWEHYAWHSSPFTRTTFVEQILSPLYHRVPDREEKPIGHRLALLFMVFAIGNFMDFTRPFDIASGQRYYLLARASLCLEPVFESPTVTALQTLFLIGIYLMMSRGSYVPEHGWILSGINMKLALTLGLQHDANKLGLPPVEVEARKEVLLAVLCFEVWQSVLAGREPSYTFSSFDWVLPKTFDPVSNSIVRTWTPFFIRDCVSLVLETAKEKKYSIILRTDAKIRDYPVPKLPATTSEDSGDSPRVSVVMQHTVMGVLKEVCLLFLHRRFFALALARSPDDPLKSPFAHSVLTCYRSSVAFLQKVRSAYALVPDIIQRLWFMWPNVFVGTLILGSIVARSPGCSLAPSALLELEMVCQLWESVSQYICGPKVLETVIKLKHKAFTASSQHKASNGTLNRPSSGIEVDDEIAALGGAGPRVIASSSKVPGSSKHSPAQTNSPASGSGEPTKESTVPLLPDLPGMSPFPAAQPYDFPDIDVSGQASDFTAMGSFDHMFYEMTMSPSPGFSSVLDELGLSGGWQPVMDDLGL